MSTHRNNDGNAAGPGNKPPSYKILVDHKPHDWPKPTITGAEVKELASVDAQTFDAWLDVPGPEDELVGDTSSIDLTKRGVEKFYTIKSTTTEG